MLAPRPSGSDRWFPCPASHGLEAQFPDNEGDSLEGSAAHWLAALILQHGGKPETFINYQHENGAFITEEMAEAVGIYYKEVATCEGGHTEELVKIPRIGRGYEGTPDFWYFDAPTYTLHVKDLKYGWGIVEPFENPQLISYAIGIIDEHYAEIEQHINVCLTIVQPRPWHSQGPVRSWSAKATALRGIANQLTNRYAEAMGPSPTACSGPHCRYCLALGSCVTAQKAEFYALDLCESPALQNTDPALLGVELDILTRALEIITWRKEAKEEEALAHVKKGEVVAGWSATSGAGSKVWTHSAGIIKAVGKAEEIELGKDAVVTPLQAIKLGVPTKIVDQYSKRLPGKVKLKPDGNKIKQLFFRS